MLHNNKAIKKEKLEQISIFVPKDEKINIEARAKKEQRSVSNYVRLILKKMPEEAQSK